MSNRLKYGDSGVYDFLFAKCKKARGFENDTDNYREDNYGFIIHRTGIPGYPKADIDHIVPKSKGGSDDILNLQLLHPSVNRSKQDSEVKKSRFSAVNKTKEIPLTKEIPKKEIPKKEVPKKEVPKKETPKKK